MKKVLSLFLIMALVIMQSAACVAIAAQNEDNGLAQTVELLQSMKIIQNKYDYINFPNDPVSGEQYIAALCALRGMGTLLPDEQISFLAQLRAINEEEKVIQSDKISFAQAIKGLVTILGYEPYAMQKGDYPTGYFIMAANLRLTKDVAEAAENVLSRGLFARLLHNAIQIDILKQVSVGDQVEYKATQDNTLMDEYLKVKKFSGIVTDDGITSLTGESDTGKNCAIIGNIEMQKNGLDVSGYLGAETQFYVQYEDKTAMGKLIYLTCETDKNTIYKIVSDDIISCENGIFKYTENGKTEKLSLSPTISVILNSKAYFAFSESDFIPSLGSVTLIDRDGDKIIEVAHINRYRNIVVSQISGDFERFIDAYDSTSSLIVDENKDYIVLREGKPSKLSTVGKWEVLSIYESMDNHLVKIEIVYEKIRGTLTEFSTQEQNKFAVISGVEYRLAPTYPSHLLNSGEKGVFLFDTQGRLTGKSGDPSLALVYGYLVDYQLTGNLSKQYEMKIFTAEGQMEIFTVAKNPVLNDVKITSPDMVRAILVQIGNNTDGKGQMIRYRQNEAGEIIEIVTQLMPYDYTTKQGISIAAASKLRKFRSSLLGFEGDIVFGENTLIFRIPNDITKEEYYEIKNKQYFSNGTNYTVEAYNSSAVKVADVVVEKVPSMGSIPDSADIMVVDKVTKAMMGDGNTVNQIQGIMGGKTMQILCADTETGKDLARGDIIRYTVDKTGSIQELETVIRLGKQPPFGYNTTTYDDEYRWVYGVVANQQDNIITVSTDAGNLSSAKAFATNTARFVIFDIKRNKITTTTADELIGTSYQQNPKIRIFLRTRFSTTRDVVIVVLP